MKKMKVGDYILTKDIPDQETFDRIRECVKKMGYNVSSSWGSFICDSFEYLYLDTFGDLDWTNIVEPFDNCYRPQEIFAMVEEPIIQEDINQTIDRIKQEIATLEDQLNGVKERSYL